MSRSVVDDSVRLSLPAIEGPSLGFGSLHGMDVNDHLKSSFSELLPGKASSSRGRRQSSARIASRVTDQRPSGARPLEQRRTSGGEGGYPFLSMAGGAVDRRLC